MNQNTIIYGANRSGVELRSKLTKADRVVCYVDHDRDKIGREFDGLPVLAPSSLMDLEFERIALSQADPGGALSLLLRLGIPLDKILVPGIEGLVSKDSLLPRIVIFGCGMGALRTKEFLEPEHEILCFCESDSAWHGKQLARRFVISPADLSAISFDKIYLGVSDTHRALHELLWSWNVPIEKIDVAPEDVLSDRLESSGSGRLRYVIFGAGMAGERVFAQLKHDADIIAFVDNSTEKVGTEKCGRPVVAPDTLPSMDYDRVAVGSMYVASILEQLHSMGIACSRVWIPPTEWIQGLRHPKRGSFWTRWLQRS